MSIGETMSFYDSVTGMNQLFESKLSFSLHLLRYGGGKILFQAPKGRSMVAFLKETESHGWPSFRDEEVCHLCCVLKVGSLCRTWV